MTRSVPQIYQISEKEYNIFRGFFNVGYKTAVTATLTGLAGIVADIAFSHFGDPKNSQLTKEIMTYAVPLSIGGGLFSLYFGINYYINPQISKIDRTEK